MNDLEKKKDRFLIAIQISIALFVVLPVIGLCLHNSHGISGYLIVLSGIMPFCSFLYFSYLYDKEFEDQSFYTGADSFSLSYGESGFGSIV